MEVFFTSQHSIWHKGKTKWRDDERNLGLCFPNGPDGAGVGATLLERMRSKGEEAFQEPESTSEQGFSFLELKNVEK